VAANFIGPSSFFAVDSYLKNVEQSYIKKIYRANQASKQIRNPNIESGPADRNKAGPK
jgi:hypothetical protein